MSSAARAAALAAVAFFLPACNITFTGDGGTVAPPPQNPFVLQTPIDNSTGVPPTNPQFSWSPLAGATNYRIQIALSASFSDILYDDASITTTSVFLNLPFTNETVYYWRVYGMDAGGVGVLAGGSPFRFKTLLPPPAAPAQFFLVSPVLAGTSRTPTFTWTSSSGASRYWLQVDTSPGFATLVVDLPNLHWNQAASPVTLNPSTTYYWRVTASNGWSTTVSSPTSASFITAP